MIRRAVRVFQDSVGQTGGCQGASKGVPVEIAPLIKPKEQQVVTGRGIAKNQQVATREDLLQRGGGFGAGGAGFWNVGVPDEVFQADAARRQAAAQAVKMLEVATGAGNTMKT